MVARINTGKSIAKALNYNEQKVKTRQAEILSASGFLKEADQLNFYDKIRHFEKYTSLNEQAITNSLHVSLSFDPSEKLSNEKMVAIADTYMEQIGFGNQLFLVYRHHDAGHPHLHIVSTNIGKDGKRISMHNLGRNQSESARKQIEATFNLVKAESKKMAADGRLVPVSVQRVSYGKSATKQAISNVLAVVIEGYKYNSLHELNAVLKLYNVTADRGTEGSRQYEHHGLVYRVLDDAGNRVGKPVKASAFYMKPTLANLEKRFSENEVEKAPHRKRLQTTIGWILNKKPASLEAFIKGLEKENISTVLRRGKEG
ncbi:MAG: relaxase/mobilization nuclease domain-containing protein, partial [Ferruginibacter sp.]